MSLLLPACHTHCLALPALLRCAAFYTLHCLPTCTPTTCLFYTQHACPTTPLPLCLTHLSFLYCHHEHSPLQQFLHYHAFKCKHTPHTPRPVCPIVCVYFLPYFTWPLQTCNLLFAFLTFLPSLPHICHLYKLYARLSVYHLSVSQF